MKAIIFLFLVGFASARLPVLDRYLASTQKSVLDNPDCDCIDKNEELSRQREVAGRRLAFIGGERYNPLGPCGCNGGKGSGSKPSTTLGGKATQFDASSSTERNQCSLKCSELQQQCQQCCGGSAVYSNCKVNLGKEACTKDCDFALDTCDHTCGQWN